MGTMETHVENPVEPKLDEVEKTLIERVNNKAEELSIDFQGIASGEEVYLSFPPKIKEEYVKCENNSMCILERRSRVRNHCIFRFLAYYDEYPEQVQNEVLNCLSILKDKCGDSENRRIAQEVLEDLVHFNWRRKAAWGDTRKVATELKK